MMASSSSRALVGATSPARIRRDQAVDRGQPAEVHRPGLHDVQRAGGRRCRPAVCGEVDRRVDDVDFAARRRRTQRRWPSPGPWSRSPASRTPSEWRRCSLRGRGSRRRARSRRRRARRGLRSESRAHAAGRRLGLPNDSAELFALTCPPWLARTVTGQIHSTPLSVSRPTRSSATSRRRRTFRLLLWPFGVFAHIVSACCMTGATTSILQGSSNPLSTNHLAHRRCASPMPTSPHRAM